MKKNVCIARMAFFKDNPRLIRSANLYKQMGYCVDVICLKYENESSCEIIDDINIYYMPLKKDRKNKLTYLLYYFKGIILGSFYISFLYFKKKYSLIQIHTLPDIFTISAIIPKLLGVPILVDLHDPMPEQFLAKYNNKKSLWIKVLKFFEIIPGKMGSCFITQNDNYRRLYISRSFPKDKIKTIHNSPDERFLDYSKQLNFNLDNLVYNKKYVNIIYTGELTKRHGIYRFISLFPSLVHNFHNLRLHVIGFGEEKPKILKFINEHNYEKYIRIYNLLPYYEISKIILKSDIGLICSLNDEFFNYNVPNRLFEFALLEIPILMTKTLGVLDYVDENDVFFFDIKNVHSIIESINLILEDENELKSKIESCYKKISKYSWNIEKNYYKKIITNLIEGEEHCGFRNN